MSDASEEHSLEKIGGRRRTDEDDIELRIRLQKEMVKQALKDGLKEWLNEKFSEVGRWTIRAGAAAGLAAIVYFVLQFSGWHPPVRP